jgi:hypothetical protein
LHSSSADSLLCSEYDRHFQRVRGGWQTRGGEHGRPQRPVGSCQRIFAVSKNLPVEGEPLVLPVNCRNTQAINKLVTAFYEGGTLEAIGPEGPPVVTLNITFVTLNISYGGRASRHRVGYLQHG